MPTIRDAAQRSFSPPQPGVYGRKKINRHPSVCPFIIISPHVTCNDPENHPKELSEAAVSLRPQWSRRASHPSCRLTWRVEAVPEPSASPTTACPPPGGSALSFDSFIHRSLRFGQGSILLVEFHRALTFCSSPQDTAPRRS